MRCQALLIAAALAAATVPARAQCPPGTVLLGTQCVQHCPPGMWSVHGRCLPPPPPRSSSGTSQGGYASGGGGYAGPSYLQPDWPRNRPTPPPQKQMRQ